MVEAFDLKIKENNNDGDIEIIFTNLDQEKNYTKNY